MSSIRFLFGLIVVTLGFVSQVQARWALVETTSVPINRVLSNLTVRATAETNNFELIHALARLHSLSYAGGASNWNVEFRKEEILTNTKKEEQLLWFGYHFALPPDDVQAAPTPEQRRNATEHLNEAIAFYRQANLLQPTNEFVLLGFGWCEIQAGETNLAKQVLRRAVKFIWDHDKKSPYFDANVTQEAIDYLRPLLDPLKDRQELKELSSVAEKAFRLRRAMTPLILPLKGDHSLTSLINTNASVAFDLDGSGIPNRKWQWITTNAAWIVHLPQGGPVTSALQMFGNVTFWMFWENGYHALASLDDNADGVLTGDELRGIRLWQDRNSDGQCTPDEILELKYLGITALDTRYFNENGTLTSPTGAHFNDGSTRPTYDIVLHQLQ